jgi:hypothetical protein
MNYTTVFRDTIPSAAPIPHAYFPNSDNDTPFLSDFEDTKALPTGRAPAVEANVTAEEREVRFERPTLAERAWAFSHAGRGANGLNECENGDCEESSQHFDGVFCYGCDRWCCKGCRERGHLCPEFEVWICPECWAVPSDEIHPGMLCGCEKSPLPLGLTLRPEPALPTNDKSFLCPFHDGSDLDSQECCCLHPISSSERFFCELPEPCFSEDCICDYPSSDSEDTVLLTLDEMKKEKIKTEPESELEPELEFELEAPGEKDSAVADRPSHFLDLDLQAERNRYYNIAVPDPTSNEFSSPGVDLTNIFGNWEVLNSNMVKLSVEDNMPPKIKVSRPVSPSPTALSENVNDEASTLLPARDKNVASLVRNKKEERLPAVDSDDVPKRKKNGGEKPKRGPNKKFLTEPDLLDNYKNMRRSERNKKKPIEFWKASAVLSHREESK